MSELVETLLQAYFHEDWPEEARNASELVDQFIRTSGLAADEFECLATDLRKIAQQHEDQPNGWLFRELGCYFDPSSDGQTDSEWLREISQQLIAKNAHAPR